MPVVDASLFEKRIYVVVAQTVQPTEGTSVIQACGRNAAQVGHVVSAMRVAVDRRQEKALRRSRRRIAEGNLAVLFQHSAHEAIQPITTIVLAARDSKELAHIWNLLRSVPCHQFLDHNQKVYRTAHPVLTAICTEPIEPEKVVGILDYLPLWSCGAQCV